VVTLSSGACRADQRPLYGVVDLEQWVPANHPLRSIRRAVDFSFVRAEVAPCYGCNGNESVDPEVILNPHIASSRADVS
jgi:hypothetical protein